MSSPEPATPAASSTAGKFIIISSVMFVFISYWRVAAVVLCDLASTAFYIGGIVEHSIGPAAPWFIVGVMAFSYAVRSVYIESCSMFVRGGVYRIVKESLGRTTAKIAVAALLFDYILTGPISGVSAGQYLMSLFFESWNHFGGSPISPAVRDFWKSLGSVVIACAITFYFFRLNVIGIRESSDKALKIMIITTVMGVIILSWSIFTLAIEGPRNAPVFKPTFDAKTNPATGQPESPLGFLEGTGLAGSLQSDWSWLSAIGLIGFFIAFGHSVLAMSGEETLAQIYREVESPKLKNFQKAAFIVFVYSLVLTGGISILAVLLIPEDVRMSQFGDNLIGGLAMNVYGPPIARLALNAFVVCVGSLILAGAVNTAIIGSNGVLNRVAEDGVIPVWMTKPHPKFGTTHRILYLIFGLQIFTILVSHGDVLLLGEAYAFGVVWSFVFNCLAMLALRFQEPGRHRGFKVPLNIRIGQTEIPVGLGLIFLTLLAAAVTNALTKEIATIAGLAFTVTLFTVFVVTERLQRKLAKKEPEEHLDEFNEVLSDSITPEMLSLKHPYRKVAAIRAVTRLEPLQRSLAESDPESTDLVVLTVNVRPVGGLYSEPVKVNVYDQQLMNSIEKQAEEAGKTVVPIIVSTNDPIHAIMQTVQTLGAQELLLGLSEKHTPSQQFDQCVHIWDQLHGNHTAPLTIRIVGPKRDYYADIGGGNRIPTSSNLGSAQAEELDVGTAVSALVLHDDSEESIEMLQFLVRILDSKVHLSSFQILDADSGRYVVDLPAAMEGGQSFERWMQNADNLKRSDLTALLRTHEIDLVIASKEALDNGGGAPTAIRSWSNELVQGSSCRELFVSHPKTTVTQG